MIISKRQKRIRRHARVRAQISGTQNRPRFSVFRSNRHVWAELIDDLRGETLAAASDRDLSSTNETKEKMTAKAERVGTLVATKAREKKIHEAVFDRGGYTYHGITKAMAEGARKAGLKI